MVDTRGSPSDPMWGVVSECVARELAKSDDETCRQAWTRFGQWMRTIQTIALALRESEHEVRGYRFEKDQAEVRALRLAEAFAGMEHRLKELQITNRDLAARILREEYSRRIPTGRRPEDGAGLLLSPKAIAARQMRRWMLRSSRSPLKSSFQVWVVFTYHQCWKDIHNYDASVLRTRGETIQRGAARLIAGLLTRRSETFVRRAWRRWKQASDMNRTMVINPKVVLEAQKRRVQSIGARWLTAALSRRTTKTIARALGCWKKVAAYDGALAVARAHRREDVHEIAARWIDGLASRQSKDLIREALARWKDTIASKRSRNSCQIDGARWLTGLVSRLITTKRAWRAMVRWKQTCAPSQLQDSIAAQSRQEQLLGRLSRLHERNHERNQRSHLAQAMAELEQKGGKEEEEEQEEEGEEEEADRIQLQMFADDVAERKSPPATPTTPSAKSIQSDQEEPGQSYPATREEISMKPCSIVEIPSPSSLERRPSVTTMTTPSPPPIASADSAGGGRAGEGL